VNTDNRLFSRTSVTDELWSVHQHCQIDADQLREIAINGFRYAFIHRDQKQAMLRSVIDDFPLAPSQETPMW